jgi:signal transduction histidine kinase
MHLRRVLVHVVSLAGLLVLVIAVHGLVVLGIGNVPTAGQRTLLVASMVAAAATAVLYGPLRAWLRSMAVRALLRPHRSLSDVLAAVANRLARPMPLDELLLQVTEFLRRALALESAEIWTGAAGTYERAAADPDRPPRVLSLTREEQLVVSRAGVGGRAWASAWLPQLLDGRPDGELRIVPATHAGELLGLLVVGRAADGEAFGADADELLLTLARQLGLALHNVRLGSALEASSEELREQAVELRASRARVVAAADAARRRIERDLHDGAQASLFALAVNVRLARELAPCDPARAGVVLAAVSHELEEAIERVRDLARGVYPSVLSDRGLPDGLRAAADCAALTTRLEVAARRRFGPEVEATVYFCCLEALQNAARHAGAGARATIRVWEDDRGLNFEVADDGAGFDAAAASGGSGLTHLGDRVGALGGQLVVRSAAGRGTTIGGWVPVPRRPAAVGLTPRPGTGARP